MLFDSVLMRNWLKISTGDPFADWKNLGILSLLLGMLCSMAGFRVKYKALLRARFYFLRLLVLGYTLYDTCYNDLEKINGPDIQRHWASLCFLESC